MKLKFGASVKTRCLIVNLALMINLRVTSFLSRKNVIKSNTGFLRKSVYFLNQWHEFSEFSYAWF